MVFGKSLFQPEYQILKKALEEQLPKEVILRFFNNQDEIMQRNDVSPIQLLELIAKTQRDKSDIECKFYESPSDVLDPKELSSDKKKLDGFRRLVA